MVKLAAAWPFLFTLQKWAGYFTGRIAPGERVLFFPSSASRQNVTRTPTTTTTITTTTQWQVPIHGWIFQPKEDSMKRAAFRSLLRRFLKVPSKSPEERILDHRIKAFVVDNQRWKRPKITLGGKEYPMLQSSSKKNGHFHTTLMISDKDLLRHRRAATLHHAATFPDCRTRSCSSRRKEQIHRTLHVAGGEPSQHDRLR